jgi:hypothetical protein
VDPSETQEILRWDLDLLDGDYLEEAFDRAELLVAWLKRMGVAVPECWESHPWIIERLLALDAWRAELRRESPPSGKALGEWWGSTWGLDGLRLAWREQLDSHDCLLPDGSKVRKGLKRAELIDALKTQRKADRERRLSG